MILRDGMWSGRDVVVIGGGPSLRGFCWQSKLAGAGMNTIGVNRAGEVFGCDVHIGMDRTYWKQGAEKSVSACRVQVDHGEPRCAVDVVVPCAAPAGTTNRHSALAWGRSLAEGIGCAGNSGFAALNLADVLGAETIYLLGFDMKGEGGLITHWHDGYGEKSPGESLCDRWIAAFAWAAPLVRARVVVLEVRPGDSRLGCFPKHLARGVL